MSELVTAVCSITPTQRRRFLWAVWWSGAPQHSPFRKPDAANGGARSAEEALAEAERMTGRHVSLIASYWARAWTRVLRGEAPPPLPSSVGEPDDDAAPRKLARAPQSSWAVLGLAPGASLIEVKRAFRKLALETHPDQGGEAESFRMVQRAYEKLAAKLGTRRRR